MTAFEMTSPEQLAEAIREHRHRTGLAQQQFAAQLPGCDRNRLSRIELGWELPSVALTQAIEQATGLNIPSLTHLRWRAAQGARDCYSSGMTGPKPSEPDLVAVAAGKPAALGAPHEAQKTGPRDVISALHFQIAAKRKIEHTSREVWVRNPPDIPHPTL